MKGVSSIIQPQISSVDINNPPWIGNIELQEWTSSGERRNRCRVILDLKLRDSPILRGKLDY
jgi:hypothetical protein